MNRQKFLNVFISCLSIFSLIDGFLYIFFNFECIDALLKLFGIANGLRGLNGVLKCIAVVICVIVLIFLDKYDHSLRNEDQCQNK